MVCRNCPFLDIDGHQTVNITDPQRALVAAHSFRGVQTLHPEVLQIFALNRHFRDPAITILAIRTAVANLGYEQRLGRGIEVGTLRGLHPFLHAPHHVQRFLRGLTLQYGLFFSLAGGQQQRYEQCGQRETVPHRGIPLFFDWLVAVLFRPLIMAWHPVPIQGGATNYIARIHFGKLR